LTELLIIADDLTGAIEAGVLLAKQHIPARVIHEPGFQNAELPIGEVAVLVYNTESRHISAEEAAERVRYILKNAKEAGIKRFFKKTDSTMRGNIGAELEAFFNESGQQTIPFIPAHPRLKRFTRNGFHFVGETLLHETEFGDDPLEPVRSSYIPDLLGFQTKIDTRTHSLKDNQNVVWQKGITIFDCGSEAELAEIGQFLLIHGLHNAVSGSAAMVELLPQLYHIESRSSEVPKLQIPVLLVNGSLNRISRQQVYLAAMKGTKTIAVPGELFSEENFSTSQLQKTFISEISSEIISQQAIILNSTEVIDMDNLRYSKDNISTHGFEAISTRVGELVGAIFQENIIGTLVVFGGDTLMGVMRALGCRYIEPISEIVPGVALSRAVIGETRIALITKPGGYGDKEVILKIMEYIKA